MNNRWTSGFPMRPCGRDLGAAPAAPLRRLVLSLAVATLSLGVFFGVLPGQARVFSGAEWSSSPSLPTDGIEVEVVTATVDAGHGGTLTYTDPLTTVIEVPAGAVTGTAIVTLTSLLVPRHPPTPPWSIWVGQAFELWSASPISRPITATIHHYNDPARWILLRWEAREACWRNTPSILRREDDVLVASIYQPGEFAVMRARYHYWLPVMARRGTP